jgi:hypothetical protein
MLKLWQNLNRRFKQVPDPHRPPDAEQEGTWEEQIQLWGFRQRMILADIRLERFANEMTFMANPSGGTSRILVPLPVAEGVGSPCRRQLRFHMLYARSVCKRLNLSPHEAGW